MGERLIEPLYFEAEAARHLGIEARALRSERAAGRITYRRVAGRIMYRIDDLTAWQKIAEKLVRKAHLGAELTAQYMGISTGFIYFIVAGSEFVKIGFSARPSVRINTLQIGSPLPLRVLGATPGTMSDERHLHTIYAQYRTHGEWFRIAGRLADDIERRFGNV